MSESIIYQDNPEFQEIFESKVHNQKFYMPSDIANGFHISRFVAAGAQDIFSNAGTTKDFLKMVAQQVKEWCNNGKVTEIRTNIATLMDNLLYRLEYPVDEYCLLRMGAIFTFVEDENPNVVHDFWTQKKMLWALGDYERHLKPDPDLYAFFLSMGLQFTPSYRGLLDISSNSNYLTERGIILNNLLPESLRSPTK